MFEIVLAMNTSFAQNYKSWFQIKIYTSGVIKDKTGKTSGTISKDSIIKNHKGEKMLLFIKQGNLVNADGKILSKAAKNWDFHNVNVEVEFTVKPTKGEQCEVYDKSGKVVPYVHNNYKS